MITLTKEKRNKSEEDQVEFGADLSPDDLDVREENDLTNEQMNNTNEKQHNENTSSKRHK
ncbi:hypothetical protein LAV73_14080 [Lysinibacillus xylanilyticus]|uniref:hypothetical protein n=1 Tax=Lysinibacillus xylanilyticus TaxID=582475 RepID=UPI002B24C3CB|nr:hypothetical protein [Lysinibacillus xylanilyticus]MEB2281112.1 hypothetical protein [Lysinibacillus xylanilyticus]